MVERSIGIRGSLPVETITELAVAAETAGLHALWLNVTPRSEALAKAAAAQAATSRLRVGLGVIPVDREPATEIAAQAVRLGLDPARVLLGIGSGRAAHPVALIRDAIVALRDGGALPIAVGALGPRMRQLGAELGDAIVYNWLTPEAAASAAEDAAREAAAVGRPHPRTVLYLRTIVDPAARDALVEEAARYESFPGYAAHFARNGYRALDASLAAVDGLRIADGLAAYGETMDEIVIRAITVDDSAAAIRRVIEATAG